MVPCPVVIGRAAEVGLLATRLEAAAGGRGGVVFVAGEAGIGKSRLVQELTALAAGREMRVLRGRAVPGSNAAFRPLAEALAAVTPGPELDHEDLRPWLPALAAIVPAVAPAGGAVEVTAPLRGEAVLRALAAVSAPGGGLLVLEDLHWADPETIAVVEHLCDNLERAPVLCLATVRTGDESPAGQLVRRAAARRAPTVIELARLNAAQVAAMVHGCIAGADADTIERVGELSDGIPFLVEEILLSPGLPASIAEAIEARMADLPETDRRLLVTAAGFGRDFDWRLLGPAAGMAQADVVAALDRAVAAQILSVDGGGFRFRHALTAEAVFQSVSPPHRERVAAAALAALEGDRVELPDELHDVAARLAERAGQPARAATLYLRSGEESLRRGALRTAVVALERAQHLSPPGPERDTACERLVEALALVGRLDAALDVSRDVVDRLPAPRAAAVHLSVAGAAVTASRWKEASSQLAAAGNLLAGEPTAGLEAEIAVREAEIAAGTDDTGRAEERARAALDLARREGFAAIECEALQLLGRCARRTSLEAAEPWFVQALEAAERHSLPVWRLRALHELGTIALLDRSAVDALKEAQAVAESLGAMATAAILDVEIAAGYNGLHDLEAEAEHGASAVRRGTELGLGLVAGHGWLHVAGPAAHRGDREQFAEASAAARAAAPGDAGLDGLLVAVGDAVIPLLTGDTEAALAEATRGAELLRRSPTAPPAHWRALWPLLGALHRRPEAAAGIEELERTGLDVNRAAGGGLAMARAVVEGHRHPDRAEAFAAEADGLLSHTPLWRCIVRWLASEAAAADGWAVPSHWVADSQAWLRAHGYGGMADAFGANPPAQEPDPATRWASLGITRREADVLALVIEGLPNREIAERLYLSVRTVEKHVEALLRKTSTRTRTELARLAAST